MADAQHGGTVIRGDDGTIYFIRDELLELAKVTEPEMAAFCAQLLEENEPETAGFALASGGAVTTLAFQGPFQAASPVFDPGRVASSTVMCPGTMHAKNFAINPAFRVGM